MKRGQRNTHRIVVQFEGGKPFRVSARDARQAEDMAKRQRAIVGPGGERCSIVVKRVPGR